MADNIATVTAENWDSEVATSDLPVLVDFWAEWCPPCKALMPTIEAIANDHAANLKVAKVNVDDARDLAASHQIQSIPVLMIVKGGEVVERLIGNQARPAIEAAIAKHT